MTCCPDLHSLDQKVHDLLLPNPHLLPTHDRLTISPLRRDITNSNSVVALVGVIKYKAQPVIKNSLVIVPFLSYCRTREMIVKCGSANFLTSTYLWTAHKKFCYLTWRRCISVSTTTNRWGVIRQPLLCLHVTRHFTVEVLYHCPCTLNEMGHTY
jgi:hypothetical protein